MSSAKLVRKSTFLTIAASFLLLIGAAIGVIFSQDAQAANAKDFNPGRIIDDAVFYNSDSMTTSQIQTFLNAKVPNCDTNGTQPASDWGYPNLTHAQLAERFRNGSHGFSKDTGFHAPPYTCLKNFKQNTPQMGAASGLCGGLSARTNRTAAQIINDVAKACGISPKVLIVLLQKEMSLVTDNWPLNRQYRNATGFACPDTAPCDPKFNGFFYQVYHAARQFKIYKAYPDTYNYIAGRTNRIYWHPDLSRCGSSNVYIQNQATAALYIYTPYRPNQAALDNLYGTGNSCSSYGNRNFWRLFSDWFGSTRELYNYNFERLVGQNAVISSTDLNVAKGLESISIGNKMYTLYGDSMSGTLRLAYWNGSVWTDRALDGTNASTPGALSTAVNPDSIEVFSYRSQPQVFYYDKSSRTLRHAYTNANGQWAVESLDGSASSVIKRTKDIGSAITGFTYASNGIQLYYYNATDKRLEHSWWDGDAWRTETLDGSASSVIKRTKDIGSAITGFTYASNGIQLYYYNATDKRLEHSWWDGDAWRTETLDGSASSVIKHSGDAGSAISSIKYETDIQLFYHNKTTGELIHTWWSPLKKKWSSERMDGDTDTVLGNYINAGKRIDTAVHNGKLFVGYYDDATSFPGNTSSWRLAYWSGSSWIQNTLDGGEGSRSNSSASIPLSDITMSSYANKSLQIFYKDSFSQLKHSWLNR